MKLQTIPLKSNPVRKRKLKRNGGIRRKSALRRRKPLRAKKWIVVFYRKRKNAKEDNRIGAMYWTGSTLARSKKKAKRYDSKQDARSAAHAAFHGPARNYFAGIITHA